MPIIIDGNNLLHRLPRGARSRADVRQHALDAVRHESRRVVVVFDGPPPSGLSQREELGRVTIRYAGSRSADDVIIATVGRRPHSSEWVVVTDDRGLARRARDAGANVRSLAAWRSRKPRRPAPLEGETRLSEREIAEWEAFFSARDDDL